MRSARRRPNPPLARSGAVAACAVVLAGAAAGCSTTQEKAERQQARAKHILEARAQRQKQKQHDSKQDHKNGGEKG
ncbi:MAG: hypothetical protein ABW065_13395 [Solirubrobacterales bacterium]